MTHSPPLIVRPNVLLLSGLSTHFSRGIFHGAVDYCRQHTTWRLTCQEGPDLTQLLSGEISGVMTMVAGLDAGALANQTRIPFVQIGNPLGDPALSSVAVDEPGVGKLAADYFAQIGIRHFAYVGHGEWPFVRKRLEGFSDAVTQNGYGPVHTMMGVHLDRRKRRRFETDLQAFLQSLPRPCGLLAANDSLGVLIISTCRSTGIRVPDEIAVVGVDDDELECELSDVPLSSVAQPLVAIGYEAARLLHRQMEQPDIPPTRLRLAPLRVMERASSDLIAMEDPDVVAAIKLINDHAQEPINVTWIIRHLPVARRSLERRFKATVGRTLLEQIHHVRLQKAKDLLADSDLGLEVVAQRSGMANSRWMADQFRRLLGTTPSRFRRRFRKEA